AFDPDGSGALLLLPGLVQDRDRVAVVQPLADQRPDRGHRAHGVPLGRVQQVLHPAGGCVPGVFGDAPAVLARQVAHQRAHVLAGLDAGLPPAETSGHQAHQLIEMAADGPDLYHGSGSRPRFFLRHNSKIIGRLSCVTNRPLPAQITISDCRTLINSARYAPSRDAGDGAGGALGTPAGGRRARAGRRPPPLHGGTLATPGHSATRPFGTRAFRDPGIVRRGRGAGRGARGARPVGGWARPGRARRSPGAARLRVRSGIRGRGARRGGRSQRPPARRPLFPVSAVAAVSAVSAVPAVSPRAPSSRVTSTSSLRISPRTVCSSCTRSVRMRMRSTGTVSLVTTGRSSWRMISCSSSERDAPALGPPPTIGSRSILISSCETGIVCSTISVSTHLRTLTRPDSCRSVPMRICSSDRVISVIGASAPSRGDCGGMACRSPRPPFSGRTAIPGAAAADRPATPGVPATPPVSPEPGAPLVPDGPAVPVPAAVP